MGGLNVSYLSLRSEETPEDEEFLWWSEEVTETEDDSFGWLDEELSSDSRLPTDLEVWKLIQKIFRVLTKSKCYL